MKIGSKVRLFLGLATAAAVALLVMGWSFAPSASVSAASQENAGGATVEMLNYALNLKSASNLGVFGGSGVTDQGSEIRGTVGSAGEVLGVAANALTTSDAAEAQRDLLDSFSAVDQLPCSQVSGDLAGQTFSPGVYCIASATLAGRMTVDAGGDANARFVFRVDGTFTARDSASIERTGEAQATNVYVFSRGNTVIGADANIGANVISKDSVRVGRGSTVSGKVIGVDGTVTMDSNIVAAGTGYVEICKNIVNDGPVPDPIVPGTIFNFTISGINGTIQVPAGGCSPPIQVAAGNVTITEAVRVNTALLGFNLSPINRFVSFNPALQQLVVAIPAGDVNDQTVATFFNQTTRTGTIEICKFAALATTGRMTPDLPADPDVTGFFNYTVQGAPGQTITVPVGFCSGPITVTLRLGQSTAPPLPIPATGFVVNSLADTNDGTCDAANCTLREAINAANAASGTTGITFSVSGTIMLGSTLPAITNTNGVTIDGTGRSVTVSGNNLVRVMVVNSGAKLTLNAVTIANGNSGGGGGGVFNNGGTLNVTNSTFSGNSAIQGGGVFNTGAGGTLNVTNSTFSGNSAIQGGGVYITFGTLNVTNSTFSGNNASLGGGVFNTSGTTTLKNTIVANSPTGGNCFGSIIAGIDSMADDNTCGSATQRTSAQINLGPLANNGGPTQTMALILPSSAADAGDNSVCPATDQRGALRPANAICDIGAYEVNASAPFTTWVTELAKDTYRLENVTTFPTNALNAWSPDIGFDANGQSIPNTNGGAANVNLNIAGGAANQTTVRFFNRSLPGRIKICKITADPANLPVGVMFRYIVRGLTGPLPGTIAPGVLVDVLAGPAAQGGFCAFVSGTWVVGSNVAVFEIGISPNNTVSLPAGITDTMVRTSRIRASTPFLPFPASGPGWSVNCFNIDGPCITGTPVVPGSFAAIQARNTTAEIEFTNFIYRPAILKLCKNTAGNIPVGTPFTFSIAPADPLTTWPYPTGNITVPAGSCTFVNGPFPPNTSFDNIGLFNYGTSIVVTENPSPNTAVMMITSPTLTGSTPPGTLTVDLNNRRGTLTLNQPLLPDSLFNELTFLNGPASAPPPAARARFDFDGDHKSDIAVFRPTDGTWYYSPSSAGGVRGIQFGANGDIPMAADYDGDGVTDPAVFRPSTGTWYILGSTNGFSAMQFGMSSDIPAAADFDGDGCADVAVFRPSSGTWYIMGSTAGFSGVQFGMNGDVPVAADFDGDGRADVSVFRPSSGTWYMLRSTAGFTGVQFGMNGDIPVGADYDGDGRADAAVFRPSTGTWYMLGSTAGFSGVQFGMAGDTPVPADYDGDGRTDVGVYRGSDRTWYILNSSQSGNAVGGLSAMQFGANGDQLMRY